MKKLILSVCLMLITTMGFAQTVWAPIGAKWTYTEYFFGGPGIDTLTIRSIGDTLIQGKNCRMLVKSNFLCDLRSKKEYTYSDSGKVYFYDDLRNTFQMLYNFNAQAGDTYTILPGTDSMFINDSIKIIVDSVSTTSINSILLKKIFVHQSNFQLWDYFGGVIVENIGDLNYMLPWVCGVCDATFAQPLRCYEDTIIGFYNFNTAPSCDFVDLEINESMKIDNFSIFPNPTSSTLTIQTPSQATIQIHNLQGQLIKTFISEGDETTIDVGDLASGVYIIKAVTENGVAVRKFVKQ